MQIDSVRTRHIELIAAQEFCAPGACWKRKGRFDGVIVAQSTIVGSIASLLFQPRNTV
jgi:hypothetical protein